MTLSPEDFLAVVAHAPLVSIDLIVRSSLGRILLGRRTNPPAQGWWFVPGGRILKDESLDDAFHRICKSELGIEATRDHSKLLGVFEHRYAENFRSVPGISTHYIVLAAELTLADLPPALPRDQHAEYRWVSVEELLRDPDVHENTKMFFR